MWQPTEPAPLQPAVDATAPAAAPTPLTVGRARLRRRARPSTAASTGGTSCGRHRPGGGDRHRGQRGRGRRDRRPRATATRRRRRPRRPVERAKRIRHARSRFRVPVARWRSSGSVAVCRASAASPFGGVTIASIDGTRSCLKTADGWTRTITVDSSVKVTEAGRTMSAGDLKVGQAVRLRRSATATARFTVTGLVIVTPSVVGQVTAKTATTITIKRFDGTTQTIDVDSSTTYRVQGAATSNLAAITVGMTIVASGPQASDGTLHAFTVAGGKFPSTVRPFGPARPKASGAPTPSAGTNG